MVSEGAAAQPRIHEDERDSAAIASLMDPLALERRLAQARAQRVAALAARKAAKGNVAAPSTAEQKRQPVPLPPRAPHKTSDTLSSRESVTPNTAVPPITSALQPIELPPLVAERRQSPPTPRRVLPAGVLIGFAAGAVAALGAVVVLEPRFDLWTSTGAAPSDAPSAAASPAAAAPPMTFAEVVVAPPPGEAFADPGPNMPDRTPAEAPPAIVATPPTALGSANEAITANRAVPRQELLASVRAAAPAPIAPEAGGETPPLGLRDAAAEPPAAPAEPPTPIAAALVEAGTPTGNDALAVPFADRDLRLIVHAPTSIPGPDVDAALTLLAGAVAPPEGPVQVNYAISSSNVRYYHADDADAAIAAASSLSNRLGPVEARDFTSYRPSPAPGTLEVWLSGTPVNPARTAAAGNAPSGGDRQAATPMVAGREPQAVVYGIPNLVQSVVQDQPVVEGIPNLVQSVVQNQAIQSVNAARAAAEAEEAARRLDGGIGNALRRAFGAP